MSRLCRILLAIMICALAASAQSQEDGGDTNEASAQSAAALNPYIIRRGDSLFDIARRFNTTVEALKQANSITDEALIMAGHVLLIPAPAATAVTVYEVQPGDTLFAISKRFNTSIEILQGLNAIDDASAIVAGQSILAPAIDENNFVVYTVDSDESLFSIARRFGTTVAVLQSLNGIADERDLVAGQTILAPKIDEREHELYEVKAADTLTDIARRFATSVDALMALNGIADEHALEVGQILILPRIQDSEHLAHIVQSGDTLFDLSRLYNTTVAQLRRLNSLAGENDLTVGRRLLVPKVDESFFKRYIVQPGDSLYSIAQRYHVDILILQALNRLADSRDIEVDQAILVPTLEGATLAIHVIQQGDALEKIAEKYETTVELLQSLNGIADPSLIVVDSTVLVPVPKEILARPGFGFGIQLFIDGARAAELALKAKELGVNWVKIDVNWAEIESAAKVYSFSALDAMIAALASADLKIMLNVYAAPGWSRANYTETLNSQFRDYTGPPENFQDFARFLAALVTRYAGLVHAYEIWKSPNLVKFWTVPVYTREREMTADGDYGIPDAIEMGGSHYVALLKVAYETIKAHDGEALVVAAGLAPVGFSDNYNSIDTGRFLDNMLLHGAADVSDGIGAIFSASAVPPALSCCDKPPGVDTHYESFLQYFGELLAYYEEILSRRDVDLPIILTQLGWGTTEGANLALASTGFEWLNYTSEDEQALYVKQAYAIAQNIETVSAIFLYNLNGCAVGDEEACFFSLEDAAGQQRPVYAAYASVPKSADSA
ncbi:MAG: LysM peptidoglycan-binding domain-containing protein [Chloroflexota bacterium]|nr:LysM peptidoglycan-binding domain-containing protein [Chloroflexota bacterium]MDE2947042.1 LysM peptidoglycan-binding domain-containing protein [Chloroflexota bacterium]